MVDWHERLKLLKLRFPTALTGARATHQIPYGQIGRTPDGTEEPTQAWVDVTGTLPDGRRAGLTVINDSKHGHDVTGGEIGMTALRSPVHAWHDPQQLDPDGVYDHLDQGRQEFRYLLLPHGPDLHAPTPPVGPPSSTSRPSRCWSPSTPGRWRRAPPTPTTAARTSWSPSSRRPRTAPGT